MTHKIEHLEEYARRGYQIVNDLDPVTTSEKVRDEVTAGAADQIATVAIAGALIAALFAAMGADMETLLIILGLIAFTAVVLGFIENGQKARKK